MNSTNGRRAVPAFLLTTWILSSVFYFLIIKSGKSNGGGGAFVTALMWCPGIAALIVCKYLGRPIASLGWKWGETRYQVISYLIPLVYSVVVYSLVWLTGLGGVNSKFIDAVTASLELGSLPSWAGVLLYFVLQATTGFVRGCSSALGEEIGWRGLFVPELAKRTGFTATALISGLVWALWHYPIILFADYNPGTSLWFAVPVVTVNIIGLSFCMTWLRLKSGSLWTGVMFHASSNLFIQSFFEPLTTDTGGTRYISGEFGIGVTIVLGSMAAYFWKRRSEVMPAAVSAAAAGA